MHSVIFLSFFSACFPPVPHFPSYLLRKTTFIGSKYLDMGKKTIELSIETYWDFYFLEFESFILPLHANHRSPPALLTTFFFKKKRRCILEEWTGVKWSCKTLFLRTSVFSSILKGGPFCQFLKIFRGSVSFHHKGPPSYHYSRIPRLKTCQISKSYPWLWR